MPMLLMGVGFVNIELSVYPKNKLSKIKSFAISSVVLLFYAGWLIVELIGQVLYDENIPLIVSLVQIASWVYYVVVQSLIFCLLVQRLKPLPHAQIIP